MFLPQLKRASLFLVSLSAAAMAHAQWTATVINPPGASNSFGNGVGSGIVGGTQDYVGTADGKILSGRAFLWNAGLFSDLTPAQGTAATINANNGNQQGGQVLAAGKSVGALWSGSAGSFINLNAKGTDYSSVLGIYPGEQVGYAGISVVLHAYRWTGTNRSASDLTPRGWDLGCVATSVFGNNQVGWASRSSFPREHACLWHNTKQSFADVHPAGFDGSQALGVYGSSAVGYAYNTTLQGSQGNRTAELWNLTSNAPTSIHPAGYAESIARAVASGAAVGTVYDAAGVGHAYYWNLYTNANVDLDSILPAGVYSRSNAFAVYTNGSHIEVVGNAVEIGGGARTVLWVFDPAA